MRMSEVIAEVLPLDASQIAVISGPNLALEIAKEQPTAAVVLVDEPRDGAGRGIRAPATATSARS